MRSEHMEHMEHGARFPYDKKKMKGALEKTAALLAFLVAPPLGNPPIVWGEMV